MLQRKELCIFASIYITLLMVAAVIESVWILFFLSTGFSIGSILFITYRMIPNSGVKSTSVKSDESKKQKKPIELAVERNKTNKKTPTIHEGVVISDEDIIKMEKDKTSWFDNIKEGVDGYVNRIGTVVKGEVYGKEEGRPDIPSWSNNTERHNQG